MKKGFFFSVVSLVLLIYIFSSISYKMDYVREQSKTYKESIKLSSYEFVFSQLNENNIDSYVKVAAKYALIKLAEHTAMHPLEQADPDGVGNILPVVSELMQHGTADDGYFSDGVGITYSQEEIEKATIDGLKLRLAESLEKNGLKLDMLEVNVDDVHMETPFVVYVSGTISMQISDVFSTSTKVMDNHNFELHIDITGFPDPLVNSYLKEEAPGSGRYIYPSPSDYIGEVEELDCNVVEGRGWFYGEIVRTRETSKLDSIPLSKRPFYILEGSYDDIMAYSNHDDFGAFLFDDIPSSTSFSQPFIVITNFNKCRNDPSVVNDKGNPAILFITDSNGNPSSNAVAYGMENFRDSVLCGYYFEASLNPVVNSGKAGAPSFLQRMVEDGYNFADDENGIFSFLVGPEYGGEEVPSYQDNSKLDFEFVRQWLHNDDSIPIRGMPACKSEDMCSMDVDDTFLAKFSISSENIISLDLEAVACPEYEGAIGWGVDCG